MPLYGIAGNGSLVRINESIPGSSSIIGSTQVTRAYGAFYDNGVYIIGRDDDTIYRVNPSDPDSTTSPFGSQGRLAALGTMTGMTTDGTTVYGVAIRDLWAFTLNNLSGATSARLPAGCDNAQAIVWFNGNLYVLSLIHI